MFSNLANAKDFLFPSFVHVLTKMAAPTSWQASQTLEKYMFNKTSLMIYNILSLKLLKIILLNFLIKFLNLPSCIIFYLSVLQLKVLQTVTI
jgi:hypothetical protein